MKVFKTNNIDGADYLWMVGESVRVTALLELDDTLGISLSYEESTYTLERSDNA